VEKRISLKIDLKSGVIELDAPAENFQEAIAQTKELTSSLEFAPTPEVPLAAPVPGPDSGISSPSSAEAASPTARNGGIRRARTSKSSSARTGRIGSFEEVRGLLTEEQEMELRAFYATKAPSEQSYQVLVAIVKGEELLGRRGLSYNEIYTLMWLGGIKDLPKALDVVLLRLIQDQMIIRDDTGFTAKFVGRNFVEQDLPRST